MKHRRFEDKDDLWKCMNNALENIDRENLEHRMYDKMCKFKKIADSTHKKSIFRMMRELYAVFKIPKEECYICNGYLDMSCKYYKAIGGG